MFTFKEPFDKFGDEIRGEVQVNAFWNKIEDVKRTIFI